MGCVSDSGAYPSGRSCAPTSGTAAGRRARLGVAKLGRKRGAGKVDPVFVDDIGAMPATIVEQAKDGDVVISMGAGSIGQVPAQLRELLSEGGRA